MKTIVKTFYIFFSILLIFYLVLPDYSFPKPPPDALQSKEPGDSETSLRRAYFTNFTREEVLSHYSEQLSISEQLNLPLPTYRLNYPPEEAQTIIRDQARSTYLEEIVHPFRESLFVNGFEPKEEKDAIFIEGRDWQQKITVRYVPSNIYVRLVVGLLTLILVVLLSKEWTSSIRGFFRLF